MPTLEGWRWLLTEARADVIRAITNSLIVSGGSAVIATMLGTAAGYGLTRFQYRWRLWRNEDIAFWFISQRMLPPVAIVLAFLLMFRSLGLLDTQVGLTIAYTGFAIPFTVWIMRDAFAQVPLELEESAGVDGASAAGIFFRISLPLALPGVVGSMLFAFVFAWNEYLFALMLTFQEATTVPLRLASRITSFGTHWDQLSALTLTNLTGATRVGPLSIRGQSRQEHLEIWTFPDLKELEDHWTRLRKLGYADWRESENTVATEIVESRLTGPER